VDTFTQMALGAAVGELTLGRKVGRRAIVWGGICAALPDLDVLVPLGDAVRNFTYHRSASHSLLVLAALTPLMVWLILKVHPGTSVHRRGWAVLVYAAFATHVLLDCFTVYGTQVFWPILTTPIGWSTVFIIDPLYTLPLLVGVVAALVWSRARGRGHMISTVGLALSTLYLAWGIGAKLYIEDTARASLARAGIHYDQLLSTPTPFNTFLWRVITVSETENTESFYSVFDEPHDVPIARRPSGAHFLENLQSHWPVKRLRWFTKGFFAVSEEKGGIVITDLRMGVHPFYAFRFKVAEIGNPHRRPIRAERVRSQWRRDELRAILRRIWLPQAWPPQS
jgi:inner membrane protein